MERGQQGSRRLLAAVERSRALRVEAAVLEARPRRRGHDLVAEAERQIDALYEQLRVFDAAFDAWDGSSPPAGALSARLDQVEAGLTDVERQLRNLRGRDRR